MKRNTLMLLVGMVIIASMVLAACQPAPAPVVEEPAPAEPVVEEPVVEEPVVEEPVVEEPTAEPEPEPVRTTRKGGWLDEIVVSVVDNSSAITQVQAGAIDIYASAMASDALPEIEAAGLDYAQANGLYYELTFNPYGPTFDQSTGAVNPFHFAKAREAMNWIIDRDYINREVYNGGGLAKFWGIVTNMPDYTKVAETARRLEAEYAYDFERGAAQMEEVMLGIEGVTKEDGMYMFNGEQVTIILIIRNDSDGTRVPIGDYVANQLEALGFATDRQYKRSSEASPIWIGGNIADGLFHIYTGAWSASVISRTEGDNFEFFDTPQSAYGGTSLWQGFPTGLDTEYGVLADKLSYNKFDTIEERNAALAQMMEMALKESIHVWLIDGKAFIPYASGLKVTYDLAAGVGGAQIWPYNIRWEDEEGGQLKLGQPDLYVDPWNAVAGSNWAFDASVQRTTYGNSIMYDPHTGLVWPLRLDSAEVTVQTGLPVGKTLDWVDLKFEDEIVVPEDAFADWDAEKQVFITTGEKFPEGTTAKVKSIVTYEADLFDKVKWHDGSPLTLADFMYSAILGWDIGKEASPNYDEAYSINSEAGLVSFKGFKILSENPLTIEAYVDNYYLDAELNLTTLWPQGSYGELPWHTYAVAALADAAGEVAFSADKAEALSTETTTVEWLSIIGGPSLEVLSRYLDQAVEETYIPFANVLSAYITPEEATARYENAKAFFTRYGHYNIGTGPYILDEVYLTEKVATVIQNPDHADLSDRWSQFGDPKVAAVEVDGEGSVVLGGEFAFDVFVSFEGEAYPADEIQQVIGLLYDATGQIVKVLEGVLVEDGYYTITVPADVSAAMEAGASKIEAVVVPITVAIPSFVSFEFVTVK